MENRKRLSFPEFLEEMEGKSFSEYIKDTSDLFKSQIKEKLNLIKELRQEVKVIKVERDKLIGIRKILLEGGK